MQKLCIEKLTVTYRKTIARNLIYIINDRLVYLELVTVSINHICSIIFPLSLRHFIFTTMYPSPATGHIESV